MASCRLLSFHIVFVLANIKNSIISIKSASHFTTPALYVYICSKSDKEKSARRYALIIKSHSLKRADSKICNKHRNKCNNNE